MSEVSQPIIDKALAKLRDQEAEVFKTKQFINQVCAFDGAPLMFPDLTENEERTGPSASARIVPDAYTGKPLATAVRLILEDRKKRHAHGPATLDEIHARLLEGGFDFPTNVAANQKNGLGVSLAKNNVTFRKLPNSMWGLVEWYGGAPRPKKRPTENGSSTSADDSEAEEMDEPETTETKEGKEP